MKHAICFMENAICFMKHAIVEWQMLCISWKCNMFHEQCYRTHANYLYMNPYGPIWGPMEAHIKVVSMCPGGPNGTQDATKYY